MIIIVIPTVTKGSIIQIRQDILRLNLKEFLVVSKKALSYIYSVLEPYKPWDLVVTNVERSELLKETSGSTGLEVLDMVIPKVYDFDVYDVTLWLTR